MSCTMYAEWKDSWKVWEFFWTNIFIFWEVFNLTLFESFITNEFHGFLATLFKRSSPLCDVLCYDKRNYLNFKFDYEISKPEKTNLTKMNAKKCTQGFFPFVKCVKLYDSIQFLEIKMKIKVLILFFNTFQLKQYLIVKIQ